MMKAIPLAAVLSVACAAAGAQTASSPADVFAGLTGSCWRSLLVGTEAKSDTHCFEAAVGGAMVTDIHKVRDAAGKVTYEGVTVYRRDKASGMLVYEYFNSFGQKLVGYGARVGGEIRFVSTPGQATPDLVWKLRADGYDVIMAGIDPGQGRFTRAPAG